MVTTGIEPDLTIFAHPVKRRFERFNKAQLASLHQERVGKSQLSPAAVHKESQLVMSGLLKLDWTRYPSDATGLYRPFHFSRPNEWGIYIDVQKLLQYVQRIFEEMGGQAASFDFESLLVTSLCEVFQHEYFHHITECAATTLEVILSPTGHLYPVYADYIYNRFNSNHRHSPLEEALANAYAYNSLTFMSRVKMGLRTTRVRVYQAALKHLWRKEPPGYRDAAIYMDGGYTQGAGELMQLLLPQNNSPHFAREMVAKEVLLNGNATFFAKPAIPVYMCGSSSAILEFRKHIPAPVEAYSALTSLDESTYIDELFSATRKGNILHNE